ncbi:MAG: hypothetical protein VXZ72_03270, partial [Chlamydiota bacterium]|nr:hypothetical protein [Chlamydiota bacterium]
RLRVLRMKITTKNLRKIIREEISSFSTKDQNLTPPPMNQSVMDHPHDGQWFAGTWEDWSKGMRDLSNLIDFVEKSIASMKRTDTASRPKMAPMGVSGAERLEAAKKIKSALETAYNTWQIDDPL